MPPIEREILICSADLNPDVRQRRRLRDLMSRHIDATSLIDRAVHEGLAGLLYKNLVKSGSLESLAYEQREILRTLYHRNSVFNLKFIHDLKEILHLLNKENIPVVPLKGIILLKEIYGDSGLRQLTDIDLWVRGEDHSRLTAILITLGYQKDPVYPDTFRRKHTTVDLHSHLLGAERIKSRKLLLNRSQDDIFHNTASTYFEGETCRCLNRYDEVIYLSLHGLKHNVERLIWLVDIKALITGWKTSDWEALVDRARYLGQEKSLSLIFFLLREIFDCEFPPAAYHIVRRGNLNILERKLLRYKIKKGALPPWAPLFLFSPVTSLHERMYSIIETLFPRPEVLRQVFPGSRNLSIGELYLKRIPHLIGMAKRSLTRNI